MVRVGRLVVIGTLLVKRRREFFDRVLQATVWRGERRETRDGSTTAEDEAAVVVAGVW
jgi:hypothetical protein